MLGLFAAAAVPILGLLLVWMTTHADLAQSQRQLAVQERNAQQERAELLQKFLDLESRELWE
jgi:hypothetical protein